MANVDRQERTNIYYFVDSEPELSAANTTIYSSRSVGRAKRGIRGYLSLLEQ